MFHVSKREREHMTKKNQEKEKTIDPRTNAMLDVKYSRRNTMRYKMVGRINAILGETIKDLIVWIANLKNYSAKMIRSVSRNV